MSGYKSWSHSVNNDTEDKSIRVRQVENGFVIDVDIWKKSNKDESICKTYISSTNPLEGIKNVNEADKLGFGKQEIDQMEFFLINS